MKRAFTLEYWQDDGWYVGKLREVPGVFSQGETLKELEENIEDAYRLLMEEESQTNHPVSQMKDAIQRCLKLADYFKPASHQYVCPAASS
jgi:predicted RNase H-like HicB family nuclease